jgi:hypothetical protein
MSGQENLMHLNLSHLPSNNIWYAVASLSIVFPQELNHGLILFPGWEEIFS